MALIMYELRAGCQGEDPVQGFPWQTANPPLTRLEGEEEGGSEREGERYITLTGGNRNRLTVQITHTPTRVIA